MGQIEKDFLEYIKKMQAYEEAINVMYWDMRTGAPKKGIDQRSEVIGMLSTEAFQMLISDKMNDYLTTLSQNDVYQGLNPVTRKAVELLKKEYRKNKVIPVNEYQEYVVLCSKAESVWEEAKAKSDYTLFAPYLKKLVDYNKKLITYWGYEGNKYNTLLNEYEPGVTVDILDKVFSKIREKIVPLVKEISESKQKPTTDFLYDHFPKENQKKLSEYFIKELGYDFDAGKLDESVHPFEITLNRGDVRVTTKYDENDFRTAIFGTIHECGHAIYEQNISEELEGTFLCSGASMGIHESQSLFYENFIGRNEGFWRRYYKKLQEYSSKQFDEISLEKFYQAINESKPTLIRIEADELTYALHVMVRYEIEKSLFNDEITVDELPRIWNEKYQEYLGITPPNDAKGILQDVHWAGGSFGYFPSYALGYIYAAQIKHAMLKDFPHYDELLETGQFEKIKNWLTTNIHQYGKTMQPLEILTAVTGEGLNAQYLIDYLDEKYREIYQLS
ncbi:carboxypeptidase M32 [Metabacillus sediminilitoris]|uniref:Metal-dependent carboxypeptidase n=1 Tax=Metabacillus sediminilitoris TaxID=2567941 RepID=A0A4S4C693_9BACI|nr:carboxypeptidase M32 [Metabacillus sediminilitoris]QGQ46635.1 carboxypeptidase M32 [Metabacillus sediminilitoris]THF82785.1 carboxypeptidase M32 [Metabacillus sediminilitoris]